ncbi:MAG: DNA polymerase III subunit beta [Candidatus Saccharimonadales bacterium]
MEIEVTQENLSKALGNVGRVASSKAGLPILNNILFRTNNNQLLIAATNLEIAATQTIGAKTTGNGSITVPARLVSDFVHNLPKGVVSLSIKGSQLFVAASGYHSTINGMSDEEFPELPIVDEDKMVTYTLSVEDFKQAATQTTITASTDSTRPILTGVYWHTFEGNLYLASTDGYRLSERKLISAKTNIAAIVPVSTIQEVLRTITDDMTEVEVLFDDTQVRFRLGHGEITSRLIDGSFPDYRQLIPKATDTTIIVNRNDFTRIVKIANLFARESGGSITLSVDIDSKILTVNSIASEFGENNSKVSVDVSGKNASVSLSSRYLSDALAVIDGDKVSFGFSGKLAPCILTNMDKELSYKHIIMPIKS